MTSKTATNNEFNFAAEPHVVRSKKKYRNGDTQEFEQENIGYQNVMFEKRVVRGNTYSQYMVSNSEADAAPYKSKQRMANRTNKKNTQQSFNENSDAAASRQRFEPPPNACFAEAYTDEGVETETDLPPCHDATTQTEWIIEKKIPDLSMPVYTGISKETQIYPSDNLFDFDYESEPIVQVLVSRCLEESRIEVCEESELQVLKERQDFIKKHNKNEQTNLKALQQRELQKHKDHEKLMADKRRHKAQLIDVHQHMVARVYSKRFVEDIQRSSFDILDSMCMFLDETEKTIKDQFMPWLYEETIHDLKKVSSTNLKVESFIDKIEQDIVQMHKTTVAQDNEVRRLAREEEDRLAREKAEAKAAKLAWKLQRRVDRRLFHLQNEIFDAFINKGDTDQDIVNISDFDGSDADGNKTVGLRGGFIGEFYKLIKQLSYNPKFSDMKFFENRNVVQDLFSSLYKSFVSDGWTIMIGLKAEFEANFAYQMGDFGINELSTAFVKGQEDDDYDLTVEYIKKHYLSVYDQTLLPEMKIFQEKQLKKLRPPPPQQENTEVKEGDEKNEDELNGDQDEGDDQDLEKDNAKKDQKIEEVPVQVVQEIEEVEEDPYEVLSDEAKNYNFIIDAVLSKILDKKSKIENIKFTLAQEFNTDPEKEEDEENQKDADENKDVKNNRIPLALCVFLPEPIPEETAEEEEPEEENNSNQQGNEGEEVRLLNYFVKVLKFTLNRNKFRRKNTLSLISQRMITSLSQCLMKCYRQT